MSHIEYRFSLDLLARTPNNLTALAVFGGSYCPTAARQLSSSIARTCRLTEIEILDGGE